MLTILKGDAVEYKGFIERKSQLGKASGFDPLWLPDFLFDFQKSLVEWAVKMGRCAIFADCGLGKTPMQLVWAENVIRHTNKPVLIITPLAVSAQTVREGEKFGIPCEQSRDGLYYQQGIVITNYEKLHLFDSTDFAGVVCDESSILKHFSGATQKAVTHFLLKIPFRLLCTATAAPNDYIELGCSSEAIGELGMRDMLSRYFKQDQQAHRLGQIASKRHDQGFVVQMSGGGWRLKGHACIPFWKWISSWARALRKPSDFGFDDDGFILPEMTEEIHVVEAERPADGFLFTLPAFGLQEEREERKRTLKERCELVARLVDHKHPAVVWCHYNTEGDVLEKMIPDARQVKGSTEDDEREEIYAGFRSGDVRVIVIKPKIGAWGLNWEHCSHVVTFASHSYEQFYQSIRRCWRFGQKNPVKVDIISTKGEERVRDNMDRKAQQMDRMFSDLVTYMNESIKIDSEEGDYQEMEVPEWLSLTS